MEIYQLAAAALIALVAMISRGLTGFGAALVMTPLLLTVFQPKQAIASAAVVQAVIGFTLMLGSRRNLSVEHLILLLPASLIGIAAGSFVLLAFDGMWLKRGLGVVVVFFALRTLWVMWRGPSAVRTRWPRPLGYAAALLSGVLGALFGTSGPPVVIFLENQIDSGVVLRATLIAYFAVVDGVRVAGYVAGGLLTPQILLAAAVMLPTAYAGSWIGTHLHLRMNERAFRVTVGVLLLATGWLLIVN